MVYLLKFLFPLENNSVEKYKNISLLLNDSIKNNSQLNNCQIISDEQNEKKNEENNIKLIKKKLPNLPLDMGKLSKNTKIDQSEKFEDEDNFYEENFEEENFEEENFEEEEKNSYLNNGNNNKNN